jgi:squalene monooxygenase
MLNPVDIDVVIGGGGVAGSVTAAALQWLGFSVVVVEPGRPDDRRLAGEVLHPPGVTGLAELGLLEALMRGPVAPINGFLLTCGADRENIRLPYDEVAAHRAGGLGIEHKIIRERLLEAVEALSDVTVLRGKRIVAIDQTDPSGVVVRVANGTAHMHYRCRMFVAADGAHSRMGRSVGIDIHSRRISTMFGYRVGTEHLAQPDYGQILLGASAPVLLYPIGGNEARILFDISHEAGRLPQTADCSDVFGVLPPRLREEVEHAMASQPRMSVLAGAVSVDRVVQGRVVLVGDAGGSCHPLTASGMTRCVSDALLLRDALADQPSDIEQALQLYQRRRRWPQATRLTLSDALRDAFCGATPVARVVRRGILSYCRRSAARRAATMALLSTADSRPLALLREVVRVMTRGFLAHLRAPVPPDGRMSAFRIMQGLVAEAIRHVTQITGSGPAMVRLGNGGFADAGGLVGHAEEAILDRQPAGAHGGLGEGGPGPTVDHPAGLPI